MYRIIIIMALCLLTYGCHHTTEETAYTRYHEDGRAKPVIAVASVIDSSTYELPWSLSDELTDAIRSELSEKNTLYVYQKESIDSYLPLGINPFDPDCSFAKSIPSSNEFVAFVEVLEHYHTAQDHAEKIMSPLNTQSLTNDLISTVRIRVLDLRGKEPKLVLQETLKDKFYISKNLLPTNYNVAVWGTHHFTETPIAQAHLQLSKKIAERIDEYVGLAKSR